MQTGINQVLNLLNENGAQVGISKKGTPYLSVRTAEGTVFLNWQKNKNDKLSIYLSSKDKPSRFLDRRTLKVNEAGENVWGYAPGKEMRAQA